ncbi:sigma-54-dependent Fis family transcriptional regulator [Rhodanobacter sp. FW510-R12]|uniref:sigma 54-interacting transcriptional regulator n=1 Tax=Rhodanobacter TaxID=75309 RepID=UPI00048876E8|nr:MULTISPECIES: sigma 54-interacting transcriptional regulator [Rhodanobacter]TAN16483.1 MAG: AAA family ATPase [Rhodanobacter sp.]UJJ54506.1 sigma 54-interacting transcriptional regulator [Rhodanobacter thiooxydans]
MGFSADNLSRPRVCVIGNSKFTQVIHSVVDEFRGVARITVIDRLFSDAVRSAQELVEAQQVDVFVSAGANSFYLKDTLSVPVVGLKVTSADLIHAVLTARRISRRILLLTYERQENDLDVLKVFDDIEVLHCTYTTAEEIKEIFHRHRNEGYGVVIGSSYACDLADQWNISSVLIYSRTSCRALLHKAIRWAGQHAHQRQQESLLRLALDGSSCPTVFTARDGSVMASNSAALSQIPRFAKRQRLEGILDKQLLDAPRLHAEQTMLGTRPCVVSKDVLELADGTPIYAYRFELSQPAEVPSDSRRLVFRSQSMAEVQKLLDVYGASARIVLLHGETGTGKELAARAVHAASDHASGPFVTVNCSAIPVDLFESELFGYLDGAFTGAKSGGRSGLLEAANGGSFFMDEINSLCLAHQAKLLRVLQEMEVMPVGGRKAIPLDVKFIVACNVDLAAEMHAGRFREDLYYRLNTFRIRMPPLREHPEDIVMLTGYMARRAVAKYRVSIDVDVLVDGLSPIFRGYHWPGNVRQLENLIERLVVSGQLYQSSQAIVDYLPRLAPEIYTDNSSESAAQGHLKNVELEEITRVLKMFGGKRSESAEYLGISPTTLWRRLKQNQIN